MQLGSTSVSERILIVEDDGTLCYALSHVIQAAGYETAQAHDYREALQVLEDGTHVAVLVVDLILPGVNGFALARMARMKDRNIKIIYLTGADDVPVREANGPILYKPVSADVLLATIRIELARPIM